MWVGMINYESAWLGLIVYTPKHSIICNVIALVKVVVSSPAPFLQVLSAPSVPLERRVYLKPGAREKGLGDETIIMHVTGFWKISLNVTINTTNIYDHSN